MSAGPVTDFDIAPVYAEVLAIAAASPGPERELMLLQLVQRIGPRQLARLFAQFIGLANSVVADEQRQTIPEALAAIAPPERPE